MIRYTTPHSMAMIGGFAPRKGTLDTFYRWCRRLGHYPAYEAVERYRRIPNGN